MVYDSSWNFIGDLHWREAEEVQDGDEMELDKGVLVQVGESLGKTETDLTPLFEKRKQDQASPPSNESRRQPQQPHTPRPQISAQPRQRDTSLSSILGIKRTPVANLIPAENSSATSDPATHIFTTNDAQERPRKRRKESPGTPSVQQNNRSRKDEQKKASASDGPRRDTLPRKELPPANESRRKDQELPKSTNLVSRPASHVSRPTSNREPATPTGLSRNKSPPQGSANSQDSESGTLRISTQKPRKKLMYSALLPQTGSQTGSQKRQKPPSNLDLSVGLHNAPIGHRLCPADIGDLSDLIDEFSSDDFPDAVISPPRVANVNYINESPTDSTLVALADLISAEETPIPRSKARRNSINSHDLPQLQYPHGQALKPPSPDSKGPVALETEDASIAPEVVRKQPRQFLRSHSEAGTLSRRAPAQFPSPPPMPPLKEEPSNNSTGKVDFGDSEQSPSKGPATRLFQKSISDLSSLRPQNGKHSHAIISTGKKHPVPIPEENEEVQGPWTNEALDLFDWWPPGKPKPVSESSVS